MLDDEESRVRDSLEETLGILDTIFFLLAFRDALLIDHCDPSGCQRIYRHWVPVPRINSNRKGKVARSEGNNREESVLD